MLSVTLFVLSLSPAWGQKVVIGKLGQATEATAIRARAGTTAKIFYKLRPYEYIVLKAGPNENWLRVVMSNGSVGYVLADKVARLPYDVSAELPKRENSVPSSRSMAGSTRAAMANYSLKYIGTPYKWGGNDLERGIDCSGFVKKMYGMIGESLPRTAAEQALVGTPVTRFEDLIAGDRLYFWDNKRGKIGHTGVYLGNGYFVHSSSSNRGISTDYIGDPKWKKILVSARR